MAHTCCLALPEGPLPRCQDTTQRQRIWWSQPDRVHALHVHGKGHQPRGPIRPALPPCTGSREMNLLPSLRGALGLAPAPGPDQKRGVPRPAATRDALQSQPCRRPRTLKIGMAPEAHPAPASQREGRRGDSYPQLPTSRQCRSTTGSPDNTISRRP